MKQFRVINVEPEKPEQVPDELTGELPEHHPLITREFLYAGRAYFTVSNPRGEMYAYLVKARRGTGDWASSITHWLSVRSRDTNYSYVGILRPDGSVFSTGKSQYLPGTKEYDVVAWAIKQVLLGGLLEDGYDILPVGMCGVCGKSVPQHDDDGPNRVHPMTAEERCFHPGCYDKIRGVKAVNAAEPLPAGHVVTSHGTVRPRRFGKR